MYKLRVLMLLFPLFLLGIGLSSADAYEISADSIYRHISVLASDSMEGRQTGEPGEYKAAQYIAGVFQTAGLEPMTDSGGWLQAFDFIKEIELGERNRLHVNGIELELHEEFEPLRQSASVPFDFAEIVSVGYGITVADSSYDHDDYAGLDVAGKAVLIKRYAPEVDEDGDTRFDKHRSLTDKILLAISNKASGIFFYTPENYDDTMLSLMGTRVTPKDIPIIWLRRKAFGKLGLDTVDLHLGSAAGEAELIPRHDTAYNVVGWLPAENDTMVIIGAHYDHIGWGDWNSRYLGEEKKIHYGADDNGSGVSALLETARLCSDKRDQLKYSYVFAAFTGEERGLLGSSHFVRSTLADGSSVRMMLNMDMIGRLKDQEKGLAVLGTGTCEAFKTYMDSLKIEDIKITVNESGIGPSDHTAFYNRDIPVLFFFTGAHEDYHTPDDVLEKIDADGIASVTGLVDGLLSYFDRYEGDLTFQRTKNERPSGRRRPYSVTLGIMPDFISQVRGLGVDGISAEGAAERAGMEKGDVIIRMGTMPIDDIYTYMNALGKYRKGDTTTVVVERGADSLNLFVEFK